MQILFECRVPGLKPRIGLFPFLLPASHVQGRATMATDSKSTTPCDASTPLPPPPPPLRPSASQVTPQLSGTAAASTELCTPARERHLES